MTEDDGQAASKGDAGGRRKWIAAAIAGVVLIGGGAVTWWALTPKQPAVLGSPEAVTAGEELASDLAGGDAEVTGRQAVAGPDLFHYAATGDDLVEGADGDPFIADQLVVTTKDEAGLDEVKAVAAEAGARVVGVNTYLDRYQLLLDEPQSEDELAALAEKVATKAGVDAAGENRVASVDYRDGDFGTEWAGDWGAALGHDNWGMQALGAPAIWDFVDIAPDAVERIRVGIADQFYMDLWHRDLQGRRTQLIPPGDAPDDASHGIHVTGTVSTSGRDDTGVRGVADNAEVFLSSSGHIRGEGDPAPEAVDEISVDDALTFLAAVGSKTINMSFGVGEETQRAAQDGDAQAQRKALEWSEARAATLNTLLAFDEIDFVVVEAAGNDSCTPRSVDEGTADCSVAGPADQSAGLKAAAADTALAGRLITVGASTPTDRGFEVAWFSSGGADIAAPGTGILSTVEGDGYATKNGTSMAAPHITGLAATMFGVNPELTAPEVKKLILGTANTASLLRWNGQDDASTNLPMANGAAAFQAALETRGLEEKQRAAFVDQVAERAVDVNDTTLSPQLLGTFCSKAGDCMNLQDYFAAGGDGTVVTGGAGDVSLTAADPTARSTTASDLRLCEDPNACGDRDPHLQLRYFPPGAPSNAASDDPGHDISYPRVVQVGWDKSGNEVLGEPFRLAVGMEKEFPKLPFEMVKRPELAAGQLDGAWCEVGPQSQGCTIIKGDEVSYPTGHKAKLMPVGKPDQNGELWLSTIAEGASDCSDADLGSACAPLGKLVPAGTGADIPDYMSVQDVVGEDRILDPQGGRLLVRQPLKTVADFPAALQGEWCAEGTEGGCFDLTELLDEYPQMFFEGADLSETASGTVDYHLCMLDDSPGPAVGCSTAASMYVRHLPAGVAWDCPAVAKATFEDMDTCVPDYTAAHDMKRDRLVIQANHHQDRNAAGEPVYTDQPPLYRR